MSLAVLAIGTAVPPTCLTQAEAMRVAKAVCCQTNEQATWLPGIYDGSGIQERYLSFEPAVIRDILQRTQHSHSPFLPSLQNGQGPTSGVRMRYYAQHAPPLALHAAWAAFRDCDLAIESITHLVTVSCTGFFAPGIDAALVKGLGLRPTIARTHVGFMGCHGALNALRVADAFIRADADARVLVCAVELCGLHYHYRWDPQKMVANALFADGATAMISVSRSRAPAQAWRVAATGSCLFADCEDAMTWTISDHNFEMTLSKRVPGLIARHLRPWLAEWLSACGFEMGHIASWAVHPGGPRILSAVEESLGLATSALDDSRAVLARYGNMSSPTLLFIVDRLRKRHAPRPCVALGFGPGLAAEAVLFV